MFVTADRNFYIFYGINANKLRLFIYRFVKKIAYNDTLHTKTKHNKDSNKPHKFKF